MYVLGWALMIGVWPVGAIFLWFISDDPEQTGMIIIGVFMFGYYLKIGGSN